MSWGGSRFGLTAILLCVAATAFAQSQADVQADDSAAPVQSERFDIDRYEIEGNTLISPADIAELLRPYTGRQREYGDVQRALEALELSYRQRGYSAVQVYVPEQELGGAVKIQVIESSIRRIRVLENNYFSEANVRRALPALREGGYPNAPAMSENVQLANENPARQVDVLLKGTDQEGLIDVEVKVTDSSPQRISLTLDNTGNNATGQHRVGIGYQHANLFDRDHVATFNYITAPEKNDQVSIYSLSYRLPLYSRGDSMDLILARSDVDAGTSQTVAGPLAFAGKGDIVSLRYNWLLPRRGEYSHRVVFGMDMKSFENNCTIGGVAVIGGAPACGPSGVDVGIRPLSVAYSGQWAGIGSQTDLNLAYSQNWAGMSHGSGPDIAAARPSPSGGPGAPANYRVVRLGLSHFMGFGEDWQFRAAASAQYTRDALISGEQFGIAGANSVRGFSEREVARDNGYYANFEVYSPNIGPKIGLDGSAVRLLGFYDLGYAINNALEGETRQKSAISAAGLGVRWTQQKNFSLRWDFGQVIDEGGSRRHGSRRSQFSAYYAF